jgi:hypothetical protein
MLAKDVIEGFQLPGVFPKHCYAPEFMAVLISFDINIFQDSVLANLDTLQDPYLTGPLVCQTPFRWPDGKFHPFPFSQAHWHTPSIPPHFGG